MSKYTMQLRELYTPIIYSPPLFTKEEVDTILNRFTKNHCAYYAFLTAYHTGLRVSEVFGLTWDDIDLEKKTLTVNKNI